MEAMKQKLVQSVHREMVPYGVMDSAFGQMKNALIVTEVGKVQLQRILPQNQIPLRRTRPEDNLFRTKAQFLISCIELLCRAPN